MVGHTGHTRRDVLGLSGAALASIAATGVASADHEHPDVSNVRHEPLSSSAQLLTGSLDAFGEGASSADCYFEWNHDGFSGFPFTSSKTTLTSTGDFSASITGLQVGNDYKFRAVAVDGDDGDGGFADTWRFTHTYPR